MGEPVKPEEPAFILSADLQEYGVPLFSDNTYWKDEKGFVPWALLQVRFAVSRRAEQWSLTFHC